MNISNKLFCIAIISLIINIGITANETQDETAARKTIENYTSKLLGQTPPNKKCLKIASWLKKKMENNTEWMYEFVPGNYNPEAEEFIALAHVIDHYPNFRLKILQALRASEKAEMTTLDAKHALLKEQSPDRLQFIDAVGYSRQPQWLQNDLISSFLVPSFEHPELKFICSKGAYEEQTNKKHPFTPFKDT